MPAMHNKAWHNKEKPVNLPGFTQAPMKSKKCLLLMCLSLSWLSGCQKQEEPQVSTLFVTSIGTESARGGGHVLSSGNEPIIQQGLVWDSLPEPGLFRHLGLALDTSHQKAYNILITGLQARTTYYVRAFVGTDRGAFYGDQMAFTTLGQEPWVETGHNGSLTVGAVALFGHVNPMHLPSLISFEFGTGPEYGQVQAAHPHALDGSETKAVGTYLSGLQPGTTYHYRIRAENPLGVTKGAGMQFTTLPGGLLNDVEGNQYYSVLIGEQEWMAENLRVTRYRDASPIRKAGTGEDWSGDTLGAYTWYANEPGNRPLYGALYNWYAVQQPAGLCPDGWRMPTTTDFEELMAFVNREALVYPDETGMLLRSCRQRLAYAGGYCNTDIHPRWEAHGQYHGADHFGFSALPGGYRTGLGSFVHLGTQANFWSRTSADLVTAAHLHIGLIEPGAAMLHAGKNAGLSVRCIRKTP